MALIYNASFDSQTRILSLLDKAGNVISSCEVPSKELVDDPNKPLMLRSLENASTVMLKKNGTLSNTYQTSTNGTDWTDYTFGTEISLNKGESVYFRCSNHPTTQSSSNYVSFSMTGKIEAWHNAYSMISSSFTNTGESVGDYGMARLFSGCASLTKSPLLVNALSPYCYYGMFTKCSALTQAPELPATALVDHCYFYMFETCRALTQAPELPATTLAESCYQGMFRLCSSLTQAPELPATTLAKSCYQDMFGWCRALTQAPELPATTLAEYCYYAMFDSCFSLTQAPELPATTLASNCYRSMFSSCSSLTQAPELPSTTLVEYCYLGMFADCSALKEVRISATTTASLALNNWLSGVAASGTVYADPSFTGLPENSASGVPSGWTRKPLSDYPNP